MKPYLLLALGLVSHTGLCQQKTPVYLEITAGEQFSNLFAYEIKEAIRGSTTLKIEDEEEGTFQQLRLVILDTASGVAYSQVRTYASTTPLSMPQYITSSVGVCGKDRLSSCARSVLAGLAEGVDSDSKAFVKAFTEAAKKRREAEAAKNGGEQPSKK